MPYVVCRVGAAILAAVVAALGPAAAQNAHGVTDTEIRIGNTMAYTGPAATWGTFGRTFAAYFEMINRQGGVNGRMIRFISYDDGYSAPRTLERTRVLVEEDDVLLVFGALGTATNLAVRAYLNESAVPQLFVMSGQSSFYDPSAFPWTLSFHPPYRAEARLYGDYIGANFAGAKIGILYQDDAFGLDYLEGLREGLAGRAELVALNYEITDATVDSQIAVFAAEGVQVFVNAAATRFATLAIQRAAEIGWRPQQQFLAHPSASVGGVLRPAGVENAIGLISAVYVKDPAYAGFAGDPDMAAFLAFMAEYYPEGDPTGAFEAIAYANAHDMVEILRAAGDDLSRENVLRIATHLQGVESALRMPGIRLDTSPTDYAPIEQMQFVRFDGQGFVPFGPLLEAPLTPRP
ncbi:MAG: ABC transporter substrate-binding protein [Bauldia sp.]|nr:ABC transporter substrate-binding protein [Bauldia sp.]